MIEISRQKQYAASKEKEPRVNGQIRERECMLIGADGTQLGIVSLRDALEKAEEENMDLVEVAANASPVVCRIMDYGKYKYERQKKDKENRKNSKQKQLKEMKFRCSIGDGDYETKKRHVIRFIEAGSPVRLTIMFRGREMSHPEIGMQILDKLARDLEDIVNVQAAPKVEGRNMTMTVVPKNR